MSKYKVGQKVKVKLNLIPKSYFGYIWVNPEMIKYCGKEYTIRDVQVMGGDIVYYFNEIPWHWEENMLCTELSKNFVCLANHV